MKRYANVACRAAAASLSSQSHHAPIPSPVRADNCNTIASLLIRRRFSIAFSTEKSSCGRSDDRGRSACRSDIAIDANSSIDGESQDPELSGDERRWSIGGYDFLEKTSCAPLKR